MIRGNTDGCLLPGSSAIDHGGSLAEVSDDIDREPRVAPFALGADELDVTGVFGNGFEDGCGRSQPSHALPHRDAATHCHTAATTVSVAEASQRTR